MSFILVLYKFLTLRGGVEYVMIVGTGAPHGRFVELDHPEMFRQHDEVIVFTREEFNWTYCSIKESIEYINKLYMHLDRSEEWKLLGYWTKILERIQILDLNMDLIFQEKPLQCYLDAYLCEASGVERKHAASKRKVSVQSKLHI